MLPAVVGGCTRGSGTGWVVGGAIPVPTRYPYLPVFSHILALRPYPRPNEGISEVFHEVSEIGSRNDPELTQN